MYKYIIISILLVGIFSGCNKNLPQYTSKEYKNINKDIVLNAAKKVILLSDDRYNIQSNVNSIKAVRMIPRYKGFSMDMEINTIEMNAINDNNTSIIKLKIHQKNDYFNDKKEVIKGKTHQLLWDRIDYVLGLNKQWITCTSNVINKNFDGVLCDIVYNQNNNASKDDVIKLKALNVKKDSYVSKDKNELKDIDLSELKDLQLPNTQDIISDIIILKEIKLEEMNIKLPISNVNDTKINNTKENFDENIDIQEIDLEKK